MREAKKYQFDNFVVEKFCLLEEKKEELLPEEKIEEPKVIPSVEAKKYSEEELEEAIKTAEENGYKKGSKQAQDGVKNEINNVLEEINNQIKTLFTKDEIIRDKVEQQFLELSKSMIKTLLPKLAEENALEKINSFIKDNFANLKKEEKLSFYLHPELISEVQDHLAKIANLNDYEGKISLHKDHTLHKADCRVEWENGGVEHNTLAVLAKMDTLVTNATGEQNHG